MIGDDQRSLDQSHWHFRTGKRGDHVCPCAGRIHNDIAVDFSDNTCCLVYGFDACAAAVRFDYFRDFMTCENNSTAKLRSSDV